MELEFLDTFGNMDPELVTNCPSETRRSGRLQSEPQKYTPDAILALQLRFLMVKCGKDLLCMYEEVMPDAESDQWFHAIEIEMGKFRQREVVELSVLPAGFRPIPCR